MALPVLDARQRRESLAVLCIRSDKIMVGKIDEHTYLAIGPQVVFKWRRRLSGWSAQIDVDARAAESGDDFVGWVVNYAVTGPDDELRKYFDWLSQRYYEADQEKADSVRRRVHDLLKHNAKECGVKIDCDK